MVRIGQDPVAANGKCSTERNASSRIKQFGKNETHFNNFNSREFSSSAVMIGYVYTSIVTIGEKACTGYQCL
jgi:hypothetical protein